ncbi:MAG: tRNA adenosine(34) deaminase TadA [Bryobacteraceae bacterium]
MYLEHDLFMRAAIAEARLAEAAGEVPVGAVLVIDGRIVARAHNTPILTRDPTAHAEINLLRSAAQSLQNYRLEHAAVYVTVEPCVMCAGALVHARIRTLVFGARDLRFGGVRSKFQLADSDILNHRIEIVEGVLAPEATALLQDFFRGRRQ